MNGDNAYIVGGSIVEEPPEDVRQSVPVVGRDGKPYAVPLEIANELNELRERVKPIPIPIRKR